MADNKTPEKTPAGIAAEKTAAFRAAWRGKKVVIGDRHGQVIRCLANEVVRVRWNDGPAEDIATAKLTTA